MATLDQLADDLERSHTELQDRLADPAVYADHREAAGELLRDSRRLAAQSEELARIVRAYKGRHPAEEAAEAILEIVG